MTPEHSKTKAKTERVQDRDREQKKLVWDWDQKLWDRDQSSQCESKTNCYALLSITYFKQ